VPRFPKFPEEPKKQKQPRIFTEDYGGTRRIEGIRVVFVQTSVKIRGCCVSFARDNNFTAPLKTSSHFFRT